MDYEQSDEKKREMSGENPQNPLETEEFRRFLQYRDEKNADLRILEAWRKEKASRPSLRLYAKSKRMAVAAAVVALLAALGIGGSRWMAGAGKGGEPVRWLKKELTHEIAMLEPTPEDMLLAEEPLGKEEAAVYTCSKPEELPGAYRDCLVNLEGLPGLEGYEQGEVILFSDSKTWKIDSWRKSALSQPVVFSVRGIKGKAFLFDWKYGQGEGEKVCFQEMGGLEGRVEWQPTKEGEEIVAASFFLGNRLYSVRGILPAEQIERIAAGYAQRLLEREQGKAAAGSVG